MSVDAQPRKRKDKRKNKKDERSDSAGSHGPGDIPVFVGKPPTLQSSPDEMMHLHKESHIGGSTCTKIIFFLLMSGLVTTIALCIIQYRDPPQISEDNNIVEEPVNVESSWSIGEWFEPPSFIFGSESKDGHGDVHSSEIADTEEHDDEHDEHDEIDEHSHDEKEDSGGFFSSLFGGWGESTVEEETHSEEEGHEEGEDIEESKEDEEITESTEQEEDENEEDADNLSQERELDEEDLSEENKETVLDEDLSEEVDFGNVKKDYKDSLKLDENEDDEDEKDNVNQDEEDNDEDDNNDQDEEDNDQDEDDADHDKDIDNDIDNDDGDEIPFGKDDLEDDEDNNDSAEVKEFAAINLNNIFDNDDEDGTEETVKDERDWYKENPVKPKYELKEDDEIDDSGEELFPEALEALKMEEALSSQQHSNKAEVKEEVEKVDIEEDNVFDDNVDENLPDVGEEEAQGMTVKLIVGIALVVVAHIVLVKKWNSMERERLAAQEFHETAPSVRQQQGESFVKQDAVKKQEAPMSGSQHVPKQEPKKESPTPTKPLFIPAPIPIPIPPPSLTPEPSDDEQLSDQDVRNYSEGEEEELVDEEEEMLEEEEEIQDESVGKEQSDVEGTPEPSDGEAVAEESEPEIEEEEVEEEESEDEAPVVVKKVPARDEPANKDPPRSRQGRTGAQDIEVDNVYDYDWNIKEELDLADEQFNRHPERCESMYTELVKSHPESGRAIVGLAKCLDLLAERARSNPMLERAISVYLQALRSQKLDGKLFIEAANRVINRLRFRGRIGAAVEVHNMLISKHPNNSSFRNDLAINYLMLNKLNEASKVLKEVINRWPEDSVALAHYGLVLKLDGKIEESVPYLEAGLLKDVEGTKDARLYFHLGDALCRIGRQDKAEEVYEKGVKKGFFRSKYQRSLYNVDRLTPRPWWTHNQTTYQDFFKKLEDNWQIIKEEGLKAVKLKRGFLNEAENLRDKGDWKQFEMFARGQTWS